MGRPPCCEESSVKRGPWTPEEDEKLIAYISRHGSGHWRTLPKHAGLNRCGKSCRLRWTNYLRPDIKRGKFTEEEERLIISLHSVLGNKWSKIATHLPRRTDNEIKNFWNTQLRKKLLQMGIDPETHKPRTDLKQLMNLSQLLGMPNGNLISPWAHPALLLQQPDTIQLAQIQLLQNLLQLINGNSFVNNMQSTLSDLLGNRSLINNPPEAYVNRTNGNYPLIPPAQSGSYQDISESWTKLEGRSNPASFGTNNSNYSISSTSSHEINEADENPVPPVIVSASLNQMESSSKIDEMSSTQSPSSPIFDAWDWEKLLEDETSDSFWKELSNLTSTSATSTSW